LQPDEKCNWINLTSNDFDELIPIATKAAKFAKKPGQERAVFRLFSLGIVTNRDEWVYAWNEGELAAKVRYFFERYEEDRKRWVKAGRPAETANFVDRQIKWTSELESHMRRGSLLQYDHIHICSSLYRPFVRRLTYFDYVITHRPYKNFEFFPTGNVRTPVFLWSSRIAPNLRS